MVIDVILDLSPLQLVVASQAAIAVIRLRIKIPGQLVLHAAMRDSSHFEALRNDMCRKFNFERKFITAYRILKETSLNGELLKWLPRKIHNLIKELGRNEELCVQSHLEFCPLWSLYMLRSPRIFHSKVHSDHPPLLSGSVPSRGTFWICVAKMV